MTDHKFTDDDVIKALECCSPIISEDFDCDICPYNEKGCNTRLVRDALALINRQKVEIESLKIANEKMYSANKEQEAEIESLTHRYELAVAEREANVKGFAETLKTIKAEAIKEFAERLRKRARMPLGTLYGTMVYLKDIDTLAKEMTEENK